MSSTERFTPFTYTNWFQPDSNEDIPPPEKKLIEKTRNLARVGKNIPSAYPFISQPTVIRAEKGFFPELPKDRNVIDEELYPRYGFEEVYIHVYGIFKCFYVDLKEEKVNDLETLLSLRDPELCSTLIKEDFCSGVPTIETSFMGAKLVYKKPPTSTVLGELPMIKLYFTPGVSKYILKNQIEDKSELVKSTLYDCIISPYTRWLIANKASSIGQLWIKSNHDLRYKTCYKGVDGETYTYIDVHYKDVIFDSDDVYDLSKHDFSDLYKYLRETGQCTHEEEKDKHTFLFKEFVETQCRNLESLRFGQAENLKRVKNKIMGMLMTSSTTSQKKVYMDGGGRSELYSKAVKRCQEKFHFDFSDINNIGKDGKEFEEKREFYNHVIETEVKPFLLEVVKFQHMCSALIKEYWKTEIQPRYFTADRRSRQDALVQKIGQRLRVAAIDIETYYIPHAEDKNQFIISAHATLYNEAANNLPLENAHFMLLSKTRDVNNPGVDIHKLAEDIEKGLGGGANLIPGHNFELIYTTSQNELLRKFFSKLRTWKINTVSHYNGDSFDLSYIQMQLEKEKLFDCRPYFLKDSQNIPGTKVKRKNYRGLSFCNRTDVAEIAYKRDGKVSDSKMRNNAVGNFLAKEAKKLYDNAYQAETAEEEMMVDEDEAAQFFDEVNQYSMDERMQELICACRADRNVMNENRKQFDHMINAWDIHALCMKNTGSRDVMKTIPNEPFYKDPNEPFDKKLDSVAYGFLKIRKHHCEDVEYENLAKTWESGSLHNLMLYCAIDTLLVFKLDRLLKNGVKDIAKARRAFKPMRELYGNKTQECTINMLYSYLWYQGTVSHDPNVHKNELEFWEPEFVYDPEKDFWRLQCRAGRTITGCKGVYNDWITCLSDFVSQYSTIMDGRNLDTGTLVEKKDLKPWWKEGVHYIRIREPNARAETYHDCKEGSENCNYKKIDMDSTKTRAERIAEYGSKCKWKHRYVPCYKDVYFVTDKVMAATTAILSRDLRAERAMYRKMKDEATDPDMKAVYDIAQLDAKLAGNSIYGIMLRLNSEVGGAITEIARRDNESATLLLAKKSGPASMCDTDSTSSINRNWSLRPVPIPDHRVSDEELENLWEREPYWEDFQKGPYENPEIDRTNDTDKTEGVLNRLSKFIFPERWVKGDMPTIRELFERVFAFYNGVMDTLNEGETAAWPKPSKLEVEKVMIGLNFPMKKMYTARMIDPHSLKMTTIVRGLACKKSDKTRLKALTQLGVMQMISEGDYKGAAEFMEVIYSISMAYLRARHIAEARVAELVADIDPEIENVVEPGFVDHLNRVVDIDELKELKRRSLIARKRVQEFDKNGMEDKIIEKYACDLHDFITDYDCQSREKVNNIKKPTTIADKKQAMICKRLGEQSKTHVGVYRGSAVQVGSHAITAIDTLLVKEVKKEEDRELIMRHECKARNLTVRQHEIKTRRENKTRVNREEKEKEFSCLKITDMPEHLKPHKDYCSNVTMRERLKLLEVRYMIEDTEKMISKEKEKKFTEGSLLASMPPILSDTVRFERAKERFKKFKDNYQFFASLLPLFWYDDEYCLTSVPELDVWYTLPSEQTCVSFWPLYTKSDMKMRYILIEGGKVCKIKLTNELSAEELAEFKLFDSDRMYLYKEDNIPMVEGAKYYMDMQEDYALQTQSTPLLAVSSDGKEKFLVNRGSYCMNSRNRFAFKMDCYLFKEMTNMFKHTAKFEPVPGTKIVLVNDKVELPVEEFIRDDGRKMGVWPYDALVDPIEINMRDLRMRYLSDDDKHAGGFNSSMTDFIFNDSTKQLEVINEISPQVHKFNYITKDNPYVLPTVVNTLMKTYEKQPNDGGVRKRPADNPLPSPPKKRVRKGIAKKTVKVKPVVKQKTIFDFYSRNDDDEIDFENMLC